MKKHFAFGIVVASFYLVSCFKENMGPQGPAGPAYTGVINGHVWLYDQYGTRLDTGLAGVQLTITNGVKDTVVTTDVNGAYTFTNISTGNYTISAHVPDSAYGDTKDPGFQYISDTLSKDVKMSAIPNFSPVSVSTYSTATEDSLIINFTADTRARNCIVFVNRNSTINGSPANYLLSYVKTIAANQSKITVLVPANDLRDAGIGSGVTAYFAVYAYPVSNASTYEDLASGKTVYNALNATPVTGNAIAP